VGDDNPLVMIETNLGEITVELYPDKAPATVKNFLGYVDAGFYAGTVFHRVVSGFVVQGGGHLFNLKEKDPWGTIPNEAANGLKNLRGSVAVARTEDPHSGSCQFFVNLADNAELDHVDDTIAGFGYCVFGAVIDGMDVVDQIAAIPTTSTKGFEDVPTKTVTIKAAVQV